MQSRRDRRIVRKLSPPPMSSSNKAGVKHCLRTDFEQRCAYCMSHEEFIGTGHFEIEHFRPRASGGTNDYENLFWSCRTCNHFKGTHWPTADCDAIGARYANPCHEWDYGEHLIEQADGTLSAVTQCGKYHLAKLFLNRPDLVEWRAKRTRIGKLVEACKMEIAKRREAGEAARTLADFAAMVQEHERELAISIPPIPATPRKRFSSRAGR